MAHEAGKGSKRRPTNEQQSCGFVGVDTKFTGVE